MERLDESAETFFDYQGELPVMSCGCDTTMGFSGSDSSNSVYSTLVPPWDVNAEGYCEGWTDTFMQTLLLSALNSFWAFMLFGEYLVS